MFGPDLIEAVVTVTDGDGDIATDAVDIGDQIKFELGGARAVGNLIDNLDGSYIQIVEFDEGDVPAILARMAAIPAHVTAAPGRVAAVPGQVAANPVRVAASRGWMTAVPAGMAAIASRSMIPASTA